jgi:hypothetical protein
MADVSRSQSSNAVGSRTDGSRQQTALLLFRTGWAILLIGLPPRFMPSLGLPEHGLGATVVRVLGLRHLVQAAAQVDGGSRARRIGVVLDFAHGTTMLLLGGVDARRRRATFLDAAVAFSLAVWGLAPTL